MPIRPLCSISLAAGDAAKQYNCSAMPNACLPSIWPLSRLHPPECFTKRFCVARLADLLSVEEAQERILARFQPLPAEPCELRDALGRVLAETVASDISLPPFDNSSMDGFALRSADTVGASTDRPIRLRVIGEVAAGSQSTPRVASGECARIMTGAPIPKGADAVIPFEEVEEEDVEIVLRVRARTGACVRLAGNDVATGLEVLQHGTEIGSRQIGLLAAAGKRSVSVTRRPSVAVISTGDELVEPGQPLQQGQIYNSNSPMLAAAIIEAGGVPQVFHPSRDTVEALAESLSTVKRVRAELIITSGGASVGDFDYVKDVLADQGQIEFWRVRVRPGKPLILGE